VKKSVLFEDTVNYYNKWVKGIASREFSTQNLKLKELLNKDTEYMDQHPNLSQADQQLPFPLDNSIAILGDLAINVTNALTLYRQALKNPVVKKNKSLLAEIITTIKTLKVVQAQFNQLFFKLSRKK
jgi:hypothetical protein